MYNEIKDITKLKYYEVSPNNPLMVKLEKNKNEKLYHFTDKAGADGILQSKSLWITHSNFLNDTSEIRYISRVLRGVIIYLTENMNLYDLDGNGQFEVFEAIIKTLEALEKIYKNGAPLSDGNLFLLSLTNNKKNEYLMENYSKKDGAVFEFESHMFENNNNIFSIFSAKVEYDLGRQMTLIIEDINEFYSELLNNLASEKRVDYIEMTETVKSVLYTKIINYSFFFKHFYFSREEEYRMVFLVIADFSHLIKYREKSSKKIPYIEVNFKDIILPK